MSEAVAEKPTCSVCGRWIRTKNKHGICQRTPECKKAYDTLDNAAYREVHKESINEYQRVYREVYPERVKAVQQSWYAANSESKKAWQKANRPMIKLAEDDLRDRLRDTVLAYYGTSCKCCGSAERLQIDHIAGDGKEHRRSLASRGGAPFHRWLIREGFPEGFQTLCSRCNQSKGRGNDCAIHGLYLGPMYLIVGKVDLVSECSPVTEGMDPLFTLEECTL